MRFIGQRASTCKAAPRLFHLKFPMISVIHLLIPQQFKGPLCDIELIGFQEKHILFCAQLVAS